MLDADDIIEPIPETADDDFVAYLARRLGVETREARERLSAWLAAYEAPPKSGVRKVVPEQEAPPDELTRSA